LELCLVLTLETVNTASDGDHFKKPAVRDVLIFWLNIILRVIEQNCSSGAAVGD